KVSGVGHCRTVSTAVHSKHRPTFNALVTSPVACVAPEASELVPSRRAAVGWPSGVPATGLRLYPSRSRSRLRVGLLQVGPHRKIAAWRAHSRARDHASPPNLPGGGGRKQEGQLCCQIDNVGVRRLRPGIRKGGAVRTALLSSERSTQADRHWPPEPSRPAPRSRGCR